ncbi:MAG: winged helix-turn-helix transcriptional regulator [Methanobacteriota archaeon]|nr:MAG: winged helix-turn-helix transcriptional regulator [Euryarchaeota archaeon]
MERLIWFLLAGTRGGANRARILAALRDRPRNANQLAEGLGLNYRTVLHHVRLLLEHGLITTPAQDAYGAVYFLTSQMEKNIELLDRILRNGR